MTKKAILSLQPLILGTFLAIAPAAPATADGISVHPGRQTTTARTSASDPLSTTAALSNSHLSTSATPGGVALRATALSGDALHAEARTAPELVGQAATGEPLRTKAEAPSDPSPSPATNADSVEVA